MSPSHAFVMLSDQMFKPQNYSAFCYLRREKSCKPSHLRSWRTRNSKYTAAGFDLLLINGLTQQLRQDVFFLFRRFLAYLKFHLNTSLVFHCSAVCCGDVTQLHTNMFNFFPLNFFSCSNVLPIYTHMTPAVQRLNNFCISYIDAWFVLH